MNTKFGQKFLHVLIAMLFIFGTFANGMTPVSAAPGVSAAATASNLAPTVGQTITVTVNIDMTGTGQSLGSYTGNLTWNPSVLAYASYSGAPPTGFTGGVNVGSVGTGQISFNGANASGAAGNTIAIVVSFNVIGTGSAGLTLAFSAMAASGSFTDLLPILTITQATVTVPGEPPAGVTLDGAAAFGTSVSGSTVTINPHTTGTGTNRLMLVGVSWNSGTSATTISSVNFAYGDPVTTLPLGTAVITQQVSGQNRYAAIYKLLNPPSGVTGSVTITFSAAFTTGAIAGAANFKGVDQTTPLGTAIGSGPSSGGTTLSVNAATTGNELVFDTVFAGGTSTFTISAPAGQSVLWNPGYTGQANGGASTKAAAASPASTTTMTWNRTTSGGIALAAVPIKPVSQPCYALTLTSGSDGSPATANPTNSTGCAAGQYIAGQVIGLTAQPNWGWEVQSWTGTADDSSTSLTNSVTMPAGPRTVNVTYQARACYQLTLTSGANGSAPTANPTFTLACTLGDGWYVEGESIALTAHPDSGYGVSSWSGTNNDTLKTPTNTLTMPAAGRAINVTYAELPPPPLMDGSVVSGTMESGSAKSLDVTTGLGQNRLMLVGVSYNSSAASGTKPNISSVTFTPSAGSPITLDLVRQQWSPPGGSTDPGRMAAIYVLNPSSNPAAGTTGTLTVTFSASFTTGAVIGVANFQGVNQSTPLGTPNSAATTNTVATVSVDVTTTGNDLVFDNVFAGGQSAPTIAQNGSQTVLWKLSTTGTSGAVTGGGSTKIASTSTTTMNWTRTGNGYMALVAVPIKPAAISPSHTVTFNANGGTGSMLPQSANSPTALTTNSFARTGYTFSGWNTVDVGGGTAYGDGASYSFAADVTLYAQWTANTYTVTFDANGGGTPTPTSKPVTFGSVYGILATTSRTGYTLAGWFTAASGGTQVTAATTVATASDHTLYAQWTVLPNHTVTFNANGGSGTMSPQIANVPTALTANTFTRTGYSFSSWNTLSFGGGRTYSNEEAYDFAADITLYAQWTALPSHTVTFNANSGTGTMSPQTTNVPTALTLNTFTRSGYSFSDWNTAANGSGDPYANGAVYDFTSDITLYAQWVPLGYHTVSFDANGGTGTMTPQSANVPTSLTTNSFTRTGYTFSGWNTVDVGGGTAYTDGESYSFAADVTLYAQWTANTYTVTFNANGGVAPSPTSKPVTFGSVYGTLATTSRTGYTLAGWFTAASGGTQVTAATVVSTASDHTLYAQWTAETYTVTFDANGGSTPTPTSKPVTFGSAYGALATTSRTGYTLVGWFTAASGGTQVTAATVVNTASDHTLYAQWTAETYTVTFDANGGTAPSPTSKTVTFGSAYGALATTSRTGYSLAGWFTAASGGTQVTAATVVNTASDHTLYAQWTANNYTVTFDANGGGTPSPASKVLTFGSAYGTLATTSRTGYSLAGWFTAASGGTQVTAATVVNTASDHTLYAQWTALPSHTVTFNANGGTGSMSPQTTNVPTALTANTFIRTGYNFSGWNTVSGGGGTAYANGATYDFTADLNLFAQWTIVPTDIVTLDGTVDKNTANPASSSISITHTTGSGTNRLMLVGVSWNCGATDSTISSIVFNPTVGDDITLNPVITQQYHWTGSPSADNYRYTAIYSLLNPPIGITGSVDITFLVPVTNGIIAGVANFQGVNQSNPLGTPGGAVGTGTGTAANPSLSLSGLGGSELVFDSVFIGASASTHTMTANSPQVELWNVLGYGIASNFNARGAASTKQATSGSVTMSWTTGGYGSTATRWAIAAVPINPAPPIHTVTFDANGGTGTMPPQSASAPTALTLNTFTRNTYNFSGWNTAANGSGTAYGNGATYSFAADITLYAQWSTQPNHTVTFNSNGGSGTMSPQTTNVPTALMPNTFTRSGFSFSGWNSAANGSGDAYADGATYNFTADVTLYAQWTALPNHTVTFDANGGSGTMTAQTTNVPTALKVNTFTRSGYSFSGWNTVSGGGGTAYADGATYAFTADATLYAQWTALPNRTVTFNSNGGTGTMTAQTTNVPTALTLNTFTRAGYSFSGWNTASDNSGTAYADGAIYSFLANVTLYAQWTALPNHTVTFEANGGTGTMSPQTTNVPTALRANTFTRTGYNFTGWNTASGGGGTAYANGATYGFSADLTLYAQWTLIPADAVSVDGPVVTGSTFSGSVVSLNVTTGSGQNRLMLVGVSYNSSGTGSAGNRPKINSVTFTPTSGSPITLDLVLQQWAPPGGSTDPGRMAAIYVLNPTNNPAAGTAGTVAVTFSATFTTGAVVGVANFQGVSQTTPLGSPNSAATSNGSSDLGVSVDVTTTGTELVFDTVFGGGQSAPTITPNGTQTALWNVGTTGSSGAATGGASTKPASAGTTTMAWTRSASGYMAIVAVPINPVGGGTYYQLNITSNPTGGGTTVPSVGAHSYAENSVVNITATANPGYVFANWSGACTGSDPSVCQVTMNSAKSVTANFTALTYTLTANVSGSGSITKNPDQATYGYGASVQVTAVPAAGWMFDSWSGDLTGTTNPQNITMDGNKTITATFTQMQADRVYLDGPVSSSTGNNVTSFSFAHTTGTGDNRFMLVGVSWNAGTAAKTINSVIFSYGAGPTQITLTEVLTETVTVTGGSANGPRYAAIYRSPSQPPSGQAGTVTITFSASVANGVVAGAINFQNVNQTTPLGTAAGAFASASASSPTLTLTDLVGDELVFDTVFLGGQDNTYNLTPDAGQTQQWNGFNTNTRGVASTEQAASPVTMSWTPTTQNWWAQVAVPIKPVGSGTTYQLTIAANPSAGGTTIPAPNIHIYPKNNVVNITATANAGYVFANWTGDCTGTDPNLCSVTMDGNKSVTANFTALTYTLTANVTGSGSVTKNPDQATYGYGTEVELTAIPASGWTFDSWSGDLTGSTNPHNITMDGNKTVTATFTQVTPTEHTVTFNANGGTGTMAPQIASVPTALTVNTFTRAGYSFNGWNTAINGLGDAYEDGGTYSFAADITLYAQWVELPNHTVTFNANNGTGIMPQQTANVPTALTANAFTRTGYTFAGWNTVANGSGAAYANGATYDFTADVTLYAQWTAANHTVTFNSNGGSGTMPPQTTNVPTALTANAFTRTGYSFTGWNTATNGSGTAYANGETYSFGADLTLYAQWVQSPVIYKIFLPLITK